MLAGMMQTGFYGSAPAGGTDPNFSSVVLLVGGNGTDGSTSFTDESSYARTLTANGNVQVDTAQSVFGGSSILFDGTGDFVSAADSADWQFGTGEFTIEAWAQWAGSGDRVIVSQNDLFDPSWLLGIISSQLIFQVYDGSSNKGPTVSFTPTAGVWYYCCGQRIKGSPNDTLALHRGVAGGSTTLLGTATIPTGNALANSAEPMRIGSRGASTPAAMNGWIDEVRITKGVARYGTGSFTVPTSAFPRS